MGKLFKNIVSIFLSLCCTISASSYSQKENTNNTKQDNEKQLEELFNTIQDSNDSNDYNEYNTYFTNYNPIYYNEQNYPSTKEVLESLNKETKTCNYEFNGNADSLIEEIKNNTQNYIINHPDNNYEYPFKTDNNYTKKYYLFDIALKEVLNNLLTNATNDINQDLCLIKDVKIVYGNTRETGDTSLVIGNYNTKTNRILINYDKLIVSIEDAKKDDNATILNKLETTIYHEINHLRQQKCNCEINDLNDESELNNIDYDKTSTSFLIESSAESQLYNQNSDQKEDEKTNNEYNYFTYREEEAFLLSLALFNSENIDSYYNKVFDSDLSGLLEYLGAKTIEDKEALLKDIYAINAFHNINDFNSKYPKDSLVNPNEVKVEVGLNSRLDIFSKSLNNLINYTESSKISLKENLVMFKLLKSFVTNKDAMTLNSLESIDQSLITYEKPDTVDENATIWYFDETFTSDFNALCDKYIEFVCAYYNVSKEEINTKEVNEYIYNILIELENYKDNEIIKESDPDISKYANYIYNKYPLLEPILYSLNKSEETLIFYEEYNNSHTYKLVK